MDKLFDLSDITDTQDISNEELEQEEQARASLFGIVDDTDISAAKYISKNTSVQQNESKVQDADNIELERKELEDIEDPTKLFFGEEGEVVDDEEEQENVTIEDKSKVESNISPKVLQTLAQTFIERGVIEAEEDDIKELNSFDDFEKLFKSNIEKSEFSDLNEKQKEYLTALRLGVPEEMIHKHQNIMEQLDDITEKDIEGSEELAVSIYSTLLANRNFTDKQIERYIEMARSNDSLTVEATEGLEELKRIQTETFNAEVNKRKEQEAEIKKNAEKERDEIKNFLVGGTAEVIKGSKIDKKTGEEVFKKMITPVDTINNTPVNALQKFAIENPIRYKAIVNYLFHLGYFDGTADPSKLHKTIKNNTIKKLETILSKEEKLTGGKAAELSGDDDMNDLLSAVGKL